MSNVYAIKHPHGFFKIGRSEDPINRFHTIQIASPYNLELYCIIKTDNESSELESELHAELEDYAWRGEWFNLPKNVLMDVIEGHLNNTGRTDYDIQRIQLSTKRPEQREESDFSTANEL